MIPHRIARSLSMNGKPRASGDDPIDIPVK